MDESNLDQVYHVQKTDTIRLYHSGNKYITDNFYDRYLMHNPGFIVPDSDLIDIFCDDLMNDKIVTYFTNYYTKIGCSSGGSGVCGARGIFNVVIISIELLSHNE